VSQIFPGPSSVVGALFFFPPKPFSGGVREEFCQKKKKKGAFFLPSMFPAKKGSYPPMAPLGNRAGEGVVRFLEKLGFCFDFVFEVLQKTGWHGGSGSP